MSDTTTTTVMSDIPSVSSEPDESSLDSVDQTSVLSSTDISDIDGMELTYDTERVSSILGVQNSTIRKYCALMQKYGYEFNKNSVGHRIFYPKDITVSKQIVELKNLGSLTLNDAVQTVLNADITDIGSISQPSYDRLLSHFEEFKNQQMEFNKSLMEQLAKQEDYIKNSINERDSKLLATIKESMETRKQIAAIADEVKKNKDKQHWWQFWKRKKIRVFLFN